MALPKLSHAHSHAHHFVSTLTANQRNALRILLVKNAAAELHRALDIQKAVTRSVHQAEHALELAKQGRTSELFGKSAYADLKVRL